jgi:lysophospholipase L1-like esterase
MRNFFRTLASASFAAAVVFSLASSAFALDDKTPCTGPSAQSKLERSLVRTSERLRAHQPITIVAIGSSSTAGAGASSPAASYPARLEAELRLRFPDEKITVLNRGINGEVSTDMLARFQHDVIDEKPDLVLWQVGANAVLRDHPLGPSGDTMREGIKILKATGVDVVLIDPQFSPKMIAKHDADGMISLIETTAKETGVALFRRFSIMKFWHKERDIPFDAFVTADGIHMNDWGYDCWAKLLGVAIAEAATRPAPRAITSAAVSPAAMTSGAQHAKAEPPTR